MSSSSIALLPRKLRLENLSKCLVLRIPMFCLSGRFYWFTQLAVSSPGVLLASPIAFSRVLQIANLRIAQHSPAFRTQNMQCSSTEHTFEGCVVATIPSRIWTLAGGGPNLGDKNRRGPNLGLKQTTTKRLWSSAERQNAEHRVRRHGLAIASLALPTPEIFA